MIKGLVNLLFKWIFNFITWLLTFILDLIFNLFGNLTFPDFATYSTYLEDFWDLCFQFVGYIRSCFLIDSFSMQLIIMSLTIRLTYKPVIALIKMFLHWLQKLKIT